MRLCRSALVIAASPALLGAWATACTTPAPRAVPPDAAPVERADPRAAVCGSAGSAPADPPPFELIQTIFDDECVTCHATGPDVNLLPGRAWGDLVGAPAPTSESCGGTLVVPGDPAASYLYQKLSSDSPCSGLRMPRGEFFADPLPDCVVALIRAWIAGGAVGPAADGGATD